jgi:hypothetical protein
MPKPDTGATCKPRSASHGIAARRNKLLGKMVGVMCPPLFGCHTNVELCRVRGWDKNFPLTRARCATQALLDQVPPTFGMIKLSDFRGEQMVLIEFYHADWGPT